jgi:hypothetical protein
VGVVHHEYAPADDDPIFDNTSFADAGQVTNQYALTQADAVIKNGIGSDNRAGTDLEGPGT